MNIATTSEADIVCRDLIGEAYEAAHNRFPDFAGFSGLDALWEKVEDELKLDLSTTGDEDKQAMDILEDVFEEACRTADADGHVGYGSTYIDYKQLWERLCAVLGVEV